MAKKKTAKRATNKMKTAKKKAARNADGRTDGVNKSQIIRDYVAKNPGAKPKEILAAVESQGVKVSQALVNNVLYRKSSGKATRGKRGRPKKGTQFDALLQAKELADKMGGIEEAKKALDVLSKLQT